MRHQFARAVCSCACLLAPDGALLAQPAGQAVQPAIQVQEPGGPSDGSTDIDRTIPYPMSRVLIAAKQAVTMHRCFLKREQPDYLECVRERHRGANGAGEKVTVQLTASGSDTRIEIKTGKEFWFQIPWGQRNWSTPIFIAMMSALERPPDLAQDARIGVLAPASGPLVGTRVRVTAPGTAGGPMEKVGNVLTVDQRTLTIINEDSERVSFQREFVARLDVSMGQRRHVVSGLLIGAAAGGILGALLGPECYEGICFTRGEHAAVLGLAFGLGGAIEGWQTKSDTWVETPLDQASVGLGQAPSGQSVGAARSFEQLQTLVESGDRIRVAFDEGRMVEGRVVALSSSLVLLANDVPRDLQEGDVWSVERRGDSLLDGAGKGLLVGLGLGLLTKWSETLPSAGPDDIEPLGNGEWLALGAMGAGIGVAVDAMRHGWRLVYERPARPSATATISPIISGNRTGARLTIGF